MAIMKDEDTGMLADYHPGAELADPMENLLVADGGDEIASPGTRTSVGTHHLLWEP